MKTTFKEIILEIEKYGITNKLEQAHFLAQADHESAGFTQFTEGSRYRFKSARVTFCSLASKNQEHKRRLDLINAKQVETGANDMDFVPQPFLFNTVYGSRMGNEKNGTQDNDGFDYRGGGLIQVTGKDNFEEFLSFCIKNNIIWNNTTLTMKTIADFSRSEEGAILSAIWFWKNDSRLKQAAMKDDIVQVTKFVNGGGNGLEERKTLLTNYKKLLLGS